MAARGVSAVVALVLLIAPLSLIAFGSPAALLPDISRVAAANGWMTPREFAEMYGLVQSAPGPNVTFYTALGWRAAGLPGALLAQASIVVPPAILLYLLDRSWPRQHPPRWAIAVERGLIPIAVGFVAASALGLALVADRTAVQYAITAAAGVVAYKTRVHLLAIVGVAALIGLSGLASL